MTRGVRVLGWAVALPLAVVVVVAVILLTAGGAGACAYPGPGYRPPPPDIKALAVVFGPALLVFFATAYLALGARSRGLRVVRLVGAVTLAALAFAVTVVLVSILATGCGGFGL
jgi:hypothetical protein